MLYIFYIMQVFLHILHCVSMFIFFISRALCLCFVQYLQIGFKLPLYFTHLIDLLCFVSSYLQKKHVFLLFLLRNIKAYLYQNIIKFDAVEKCGF